MLVQLASMRDAYAEVLLELGAEDARVVVLGADTSVSIKTSLFGDRYPERFFNVGIAEANMMGIAAGLALAGKTPFVTTYAAFVPGKKLGVVVLCNSASGMVDTIGIQLVKTMLGDAVEPIHAEAK